MKKGSPVKSRIKAVNVITDTNIGGAGRMLLTFLRNYDRSLIDASVILPAGSKLIGDAARLGIPYIETEGLAEQSFNAGSIKRLAETLKKQSPDIVHTHASMSARIAARRVPGAKVIYTRHSVFPNKRYLTAFPGKQLFGAINNYYADKIIAVSPAAMDNIVETGVNPSKIVVIYNGVDAVRRLDSEEKAEVRAAFGLGRDDFLCGIFARLTPVKGHDFILDAAKILDNKRIKIVIAGTGEYEEALKRRAASENLKNVVFMGFVTEVQRLVSAMDVQLNASYGTEATSLALLEGMSAGVPAIASSYGGNPYVISDGLNGFIVGEKDGKAIANAVEKLYNDKLLYAKLAEGSVSEYRKRFTAVEMTRNIEKLYISVCRGAE